MAQRKTQRQKAATPPRAKAAVAVLTRAEPSSIDGWREECERLRQELQSARQEIANLREREEQVLNRIDWVLDSLDILSSSE